MLYEYPISEHLRKRVVEATRVLTEDENLVSWRLQQLVLAGADEHHAQILAERLDVRLHDALDLLEKGCPPGIAAAILL